MLVFACKVNGNGSPATDAPLLVSPSQRPRANNSSKISHSDESLVKYLYALRAVITGFTDQAY